MKIKYVIEDIFYVILAILVILAFFAVLPFVVCGFAWLLSWLFEHFIDYFVWVVEWFGLSDIML